MERGRTARPHLRSARLLADALELADPARAELMEVLGPADEIDRAPSAGGREDERSRLEVPRQLPGPVSHFVGRANELGALMNLLARAGEQTAGAMISAITGTAGVGKTALAVHWAHQVASRFPDGQLYVNLRGYDPDQPMQASDALAGFLRCLGVAEQSIPVETGQRAAHYRSLLADRRVLVLLDNASDAEHVRPLLPGSPSCVAIVTSRDALAGLVAREGAQRLGLDLMPPAEAAGLLRKLIGERVTAEPAATAELAEQCARLPLALRVAAELAAANSGVRLAELVAELSDERRRLDLLDASNDPRAAVRAVFSWSAHHLDEHAGRTFRFIGLHPGADFDSRAAAALIGASPESARRVLDQLVSAHLAHTIKPGRYGMHDLLRCYAADQAAERHSVQERRLALTRLLDHYLATAAAAADVMFPDDPDRPGVPKASGHGAQFTGGAAARKWLQAERANLLAVAAYAASHGWYSHAIKLPATVYRYPGTGPFADAVAMHTCGSRAAAQARDPAAEASALIMLAAALAAQGQLLAAARQLDQALLLCRDLGDRRGEARALANLGAVSYCRGQYERAAVYDRQALALCRRMGDRTIEARAMVNLGVIDLRQGRNRQAKGRLRQSMALYRVAGVIVGEASVRASLGELEMREGHYEQAAAHLNRALALCRETGNRMCEAMTLARLGLVMLAKGRYHEATSDLRRALDLHKQLGDRSGQAEALNGLGDTLLAANNPRDATTYHADALELATRAGDTYQQARAHSGLASAYKAIGNTEQAIRHWQEAHIQFANLGATETEEIRTKIAAG
jgi:tetratricopeptide (TPR) repeat protein